MGISGSERVGRAGRLLPWLAAVVAVAGGADPYRPAPPFAGKALPDPPQQRAPWVAPATTLPRFLLDATAALCEQGVADPRGCEYRRVELANDFLAPGRGFVLPERADVPGRFVVGWDGQVYQATSVGEPADLDADLLGIIEGFRKAREAARSAPPGTFRHPGTWGLGAAPGQPYGPAGVGDDSPLKLVLLLRLGRVDLAESLFAAASTRTPGPKGRELADYGMSYLTLAQGWATSAYQRLLGRHEAGDDALALDLARRLARFRDLATAKADVMGFARTEAQGRPAAGPSRRFPSLAQLDELLRDQGRRAAMPPRGPIPGPGGDPAPRIAAWIRDLDLINQQPWAGPSRSDPGQSGLVRELIAEGDPAVAPLLDVLASDDRLTRTVDRNDGRFGFSARGFVHPAHEAAFAALVGLLKTHEFDDRGPGSHHPDGPVDRKALAASMRQFWEKTRAIPLAERWYRTLLDDSAGAQRWLEAAAGIVAGDVPEGQPPVRPGTRPMKGEALRRGKDPSVADLMARRARQFARTIEPPASPDFDLTRACAMARHLHAWDDAASLPLLREMTESCREATARWLGETAPSRGYDLNLPALADFTAFRARLGDAAALDEYADWLRTTTPALLEHQAHEAFRPLWDYRDRPSLDSAAAWLFNDPKSPWLPLVDGLAGTRDNPFQDLFASSLVAVAGFRRGLLAALADRGEMGTVEADGQGNLTIRRRGGPGMTVGFNRAELQGVPAGVATPYRACDFVAWKLSRLEGSPRFLLWWPESSRDEGVAACVAYLKRFGDHFAPISAAGLDSPPFGPAVRLSFPMLGRPATAQDVAEGRAIFSLEGQGEARPAGPPGLPRKARWLTLKDTPVERTTFARDAREATTRVEYDTDGVVWQAEEVRVGDRWERSYGFVGHHVIARAPASEVEFVAEPFAWWTLPGGLDARLERLDPRTTPFEPGRPVEVAVRLRNRRGEARPAPAEFARPAPDGKPALRRGVSLALFHAAQDGPAWGMNAVYPNEPVAPRRDARFDPGDASRTLETLEDFEAMRLNLDDWFDLARPGHYRLRVEFAAEAGVGEGGAGEVRFQVGPAGR